MPPRFVPHRPNSGRRPLPRTVPWLIDDDQEFRGLAADVASQIGVPLRPLSVDEAVTLARAGEAPRAVVVDGEPFLADPPRAVDADPADGASYLERAERVLVCTAYLKDDLDSARLTDRRVRVLQKPFDLDDFETALRWLETGDERLATRP